MNQYDIYFKDVLGNMVGSLPRFSGATLITNFNDVGAWNITTKEVDLMWELIEAGAFELIVRRNSEPFYEGLIQSINGVDSVNEKKITISGMDNLFKLKSRIAYCSTDGIFSTQEFDTQTDVLETVAKYYVKNNATVLAPLPERGWQNLTVGADLGRGLSITVSARFQNLLSLLSEMCLIGGGYGLQITDNEFDIYSTYDLTDSVVFKGGMFTISRAEYKYTYPKYNFLLVGDKDEGTARTFYEFKDTDSISSYGRIESFADSSNDDVDTFGEMSLEKNIEQKNYTIQPNVNSVEFVPYDDYWVGDKVQVNMFGTSFEEVIRSATINIDGAKQIEKYTIKIETNSAQDMNPMRTLKMEKEDQAVRISSQERK